MSPDSTDVLVVGAGPAGLTLATCLRAQGVSVRVVDRTAGPPYRESAFLHGKGSEVLQRIGALGDMAEDVPTVNKITAYLGKQRLRLRYTEPGMPNPARPMIISQTRIEEAMRDRLAEQDVTVEWDSGLVDLEDDADGVTAVLDNGERIRAGWVVGCDGPESMTRKAARIGFPGTTERYLMIDAHADWPLDRDGLTGWLSPDGRRVGTMPMVDRKTGRDDLWRILARDPQEDSDKPSEEEIVSRVKLMLAQRTPYGDMPLRDITTKMVFPAHVRVADAFRKGHVLLVGDAAHAYVPFGGPAIHTGMGDAENLAWKLALVIQRRAGDELLATYEAERRPIAEETHLGTSAAQRADIMRNPVVHFFQDQVLAPLLKLPLAQRLTTFSNSALWESYRTGPLGSGSRLDRKPRPGDTVADFDCVRPSDRRLTRLYDEIGGRWVLLVPAGGAGAAVATTRQWLGEDRFTVVERTVGSVPGPYPKKVRELAGEVWLVRPDGHLAWRGRPDSSGLARWLQGALRHGSVRG